MKAVVKRSIFLVVVTDLDGTLLDADTYSFAAARPAIERLQRERVPLILCSSKTRAEIEQLQRELRISHPFISENGGALFVPDGYFPFAVAGARRVDGYHAIEFGRPYADLVSALRCTASALRVHVTGFNDMSAEEIAHCCNLPVEQARLSKQREYDEPFTLDEDDADFRPLLRWRLEHQGLRCTMGGRFDHVTGATDKGRAVGVVRMLYRRAHRRRVVTVGLGDAPNDLRLLTEVEIPIIIRQRERATTERLLASLPYARVSVQPGARGWNEQVQRIVEWAA